MHRDIKLDNVFVKMKKTAKNKRENIEDLSIDNFEFKIGDFGLAKKFS